MSRATLGLFGAMTLLLAAAVAWRWWNAPGPDMEAPARQGLYHHKAPEVPSRKGDQESFHYVRAQESLHVADTRAKIEDLAPDLQHRLGIHVSTSPKHKKIPMSPAVEAMLEMLPPPRSTPKVEGAPQLIPQIEPPGGAPLEAAPTTQAQPSEQKR